MTLWAVVVLLGGAAALGLVGRPTWPAELALSLFPQVAALAAIFAAMTFALGRPVIALSCLAISALTLWDARAQFAARSPALERSDLRIVWANVFDRPDSFARVMRFAERERADIVVIGEFPMHLPPDRRRALRGAFIHEAGEISGAETNVSTFSRSPLLDIRVADGRKRNGLLVAVQTAGGPIQVGGVHASVPFNHRSITDRAMSVRGVVAAARDRPAILVGDFNTVAWSPLLAEIEREGKARRIPLGGASTWMSPLPFFGLPIDHVFVVGQAHASARVGQGIGSDHLPLIVDARLSPVQGLRPPLN